MLNSQRFAQCGHLWPSSVFKHSPVDGFQIFTTPSSLPLASSPALDQVTVLTPQLCPVRVWRHLPSDTFHTLIVLSHDPLTSCDGFVGLKWTQVTYELPLSQMSAVLVTALRLSPAERGRRRATPC